MKKIIIMVAVVGIIFTAVGMKIAEKIQPTEAEIRMLIAQQNHAITITEQETRP